MRSYNTIGKDEREGGRGEIRGSKVDKKTSTLPHWRMKYIRKKDDYTHSDGLMNNFENHW